jgi:hypothetical protein
MRIYRWWYGCIGVGFALLGVRSWIAGSGRLAVALRFAIAAGFIVLGLVAFPAGRREDRQL